MIHLRQIRFMYRRRRRRRDGIRLLFRLSKTLIAKTGHSFDPETLKIEFLLILINVIQRSEI